MAEPVSEKQPQEDIPEVMPETLEAILQKIDPKQFEMATQVLPVLPELVNYLAIQEKKVNFIIENMPTEEKVKGAFIEAIQNQQKALQAQTPQMTGGGGGLNITNLLPLLSQVMGGGGGDSDFSNLGKELMAVQIERMKHDMNFTDSIKNAIVSRLTSKAVGGIAESV